MEGNDYDFGTSTMTDASGKVYISGVTESTNAITTLGAYQMTHGGGASDAFLVKFDTSGTRLWGTYYGGNLGSGNDYGSSYATDASGNVYLVGLTGSTNAIATTGAHQTTYGGNSKNDAFLVKFDSFGTRLWGTYYGGNDIDGGFSCTTDASGNVYLAGITSSSNAIATSGSHQTTLGNGNNLSDAFLVKFNTSGTRIWGTYYGGNGDDWAQSCATDASGNLYFAGYTSSTIDIATSGAYQPNFGGIYNDAFLVKFDTSGTCIWGTYYGGNGNDDAQSCATDASGSVYMVGETESTNAINTLGAHQTTLGGGVMDAFLVKFDSISAIGMYENNILFNHFVLSPNPGHNQLSISGLAEGTIFDLSILNTLGQVVFLSQDLHDSESVKINLPEGIYEVFIETKEARYSQKWVVAY